ncbi:MAG: ACR3 family arsenite efflux transporter [Dehalococcoidia bacterium]
MGIFEKYLTIWVGLAIFLGVVLGNIFPELFQNIEKLEYSKVNILIAVCIWAMVYPMMAQIDFVSLRNIGDKPGGLFLTLIVNWLIKPFSMAFLGYLFFKILFVDIVDPQTANEYIAGMILLGVAPCTAMVFVWSQLTKGDPGYTLIQVSVNDVIMIFAFAPIAALLLGVSDIAIPWETLLLSVILYVVIPLLAGIATRYLLYKFSSINNLNRILVTVKPFSMLGLILTVLLLFTLQAEVIIDKPQIIILIAIPLLIQTYSIFAIAYGAAKLLKLNHEIAAPACLIGTSNFFELAVAVAISVYGLNSGAALATVVGVLVEVPVMLSLVYFVNRTRKYFPSTKESY